VVIGGWRLPGKGWRLPGRGEGGRRLGGRSFTTKAKSGNVKAEPQPSCVDFGGVQGGFDRDSLKLDL